MELLIRNKLYSPSVDERSEQLYHSKRPQTTLLIANHHPQKKYPYSGKYSQALCISKPQMQNSPSSHLGIRDIKSAERYDIKPKYKALSPVNYRIANEVTKDNYPNSQAMPVSLPPTSRNKQFLSPKAKQQKYFLSLNNQNEPLSPSLTITGSSYKKYERNTNVNSDEMLRCLQSNQLLLKSANSNLRMSANSKYRVHWQEAKKTCCYPKIVSSYYAHNFALTKTGLNSKSARSFLLSNLLADKIRRKKAHNTIKG